MSKLLEYFEHLYSNDKLSHAFLIGNTMLEDIKEDLIKIISLYIFKFDLINLYNNPDIIIIRPENGVIKKEKIKELIENISKTSQFNNNKIYIIDECEKLNDFSYNSLLKTLEEPENNIYAFLITKSIDSIKDTIASRCQKIFISTYQNNYEVDLKYKNLGDKIINNIENNSINIMFQQPNIYSEIGDRNDLKNMLYYLLEQYHNSIYKLIEGNNDFNIITRENSIEQLSKKIIIINRNINRIDNYLNKNTSLDRFIIEMWRCKQ